MSDLAVLKTNLALAIRMLTAEAIMDFNGHLSYRIPGTDRVLINPRKIARTALRAQDIITIDLDGKLIEGDLEPVSENPIHTRVYAARPDVFCVAHIHPQYATVFSIAQKPLVPVFTTGSFLPRAGAPVYDDPDLIRTRAQGDAVAQTLGAESVVLLRGHGAVVVASDIECCFNACIWLEENAKKLLWASAIGVPRVFSDDEIKRVRASMLTPEVIRKTWDYYIAKYRASGVL
jgi:L-fuculose-phosphate aldolase